MSGSSPERRALIVSGAGDYADPWHDYATTSARVGEILEGEGFAVEITEEVDHGVSSIDGRIGLLVVNAGESAGDHDMDAIRAGLARHVDSGGAVLAMHSSASAFSGLDEWERILGARWIAGKSMHPSIGEGQVHVYRDRHPIVSGIEDFTVFDERYCYLRLAQDVVPLADHEHDGARHPLLWARALGPTRSVYDALGHDGRSFDAAGHDAILGRAARWLAGDLPAR